MHGRMRSIKTLEETLEAGIVSDVVFHKEVHIRFGESRVDHHVRGDDTGGRAGEVGSGEVGLEDEVTADMVGNGVGDGDILESTGVDLVVVVGVAPSTDTVIGGVGKDRRVEKVGGI